MVSTSLPSLSYVQSIVLAKGWDFGRQTSQKLFQLEKLSNSFWQIYTFPSCHPLPFL